MPRVVIKKKDYKKRDLTERIRGRMISENVTQADLAGKLNVSQPGMSYKIKNAQFDYIELTTIFNELKFSDEDILKFMKI